MDSITHIVLGACIGELVAGKKLGKKAMLLGAVAQSLPDIDVVASFWLNTSSDLLAHRGFTHSLLFAVLVTPLLAFFSKRWHRKPDITFSAWMFFWGLQIFVHIFIDSFNAYGTGWLEPFSHHRFSFNTIFVADPLLTIWPLIASIVLLLLKNTNDKRRWWAKCGLVLSSVYFIYCVLNKILIDNTVQSVLKTEQISFNRYFTTPTPLNSLLWFVVAENDSGYNIGYRSVFDRSNSITFHYVNRNESLLKSLKGNEDLQHLIRFSQGYYSAEMWHDTLVFNDLRFGDMAGWQYPDAKFVFHFYLQPPQENKLVVQRGRFAAWNKEAMLSLLKRIRGN
jgi:inner membrane protein